MASHSTMANHLRGDCDIGSYDKARVLDTPGFPGQNTNCDAVAGNTKIADA